MKNKFKLIVLVVSLGFVQLNAQVSGGIKAGANMTNHILKNMDNTESRMKVGASVGGFVKYDFTNTFGLQVDMMFHYKASELKDKRTTSVSDIEYWGMDVPVYAVLSTNTGNGKWYLGVGPYAGMGFSAKNTTIDTDLYDTKFMKRFEFGGASILGYEFTNGIQINANYQLGLLNILDKNRGNSKLRNQYVSLGLGYRF